MSSAHGMFACLRLVREDSWDELAPEREQHAIVSDDPQASKRRWMLAEGTKLSYNAGSSVCSMLQDTRHEEHDRGRL